MASRQSWFVPVTRAAAMQITHKKHVHAPHQALSLQRQAGFANQQRGAGTALPPGMVGASWAVGPCFKTCLERTNRCSPIRAPPSWLCLPAHPPADRTRKNREEARVRHGTWPASAGACCCHAKAPNPLQTLTKEQQHPRAAPTHLQVRLLADLLSRPGGATCGVLRIREGGCSAGVDSALPAVGPLADGARCALPPQPLAVCSLTHRAHAQALLDAALGGIPRARHAVGEGVPPAGRARETWVLLGPKV